MFDINIDLLALIVVHLQEQTCYNLLQCNRKLHQILLNETLWKRCFSLTHGYPLPPKISIDVYYRSLKHIVCQRKVIAPHIKPLYLTGNVLVDVFHNTYILDATMTLVPCRFSIREVIWGNYGSCIYLNFRRELIFVLSEEEICLARDVHFASCYEMNIGFFLFFGNNQELKYIFVNELVALTIGQFQVIVLQYAIHTTFLGFSYHQKRFARAVTDVGVYKAFDRIQLYVRTCDNTLYRGELTSSIDEVIYFGKHDFLNYLFDSVTFHVLDQASFIKNIGDKLFLLREEHGCLLVSIINECEQSYKIRSSLSSITCGRYNGVLELMTEDKQRFSASIFRKKDSCLALCDSLE